MFLSWMACLPFIAVLLHWALGEALNRYGLGPRLGKSGQKWSIAKIYLIDMCPSDESDFDRSIRFAHHFAPRPSNTILIVRSIISRSNPTETFLI
jgi:hypothetical protein